MPSKATQQATALSDAFAAAGFNREVNDFRMATAAMIRKGQPRDFALLIVNTLYDAAELPDEGHVKAASLGANEHMPSSGKASPSKRDFVFPPSRPQPGKDEADGEIAKRNALLVLEKFKTLTNKEPWLDICYHELAAMSRDGAISRDIKKQIDKNGVLTGTERFKTLRELLKPKDIKWFKKIMDKHAA